MLDKKIIDYLKQEVISKKKNPIFLETGFGIGTGALQALECGFSKIISIEIDDDLVEKGKENFRKFIDDGSLILVKGDSSEKIQEYFNSTIDVTFLDAHGQFNFDSKKVISAPLEKELEFIQKNITGDQIIIIDDYSKIKNSFYFSDDNWKSKLSKKKLKNILSKFNRQKIEYPYYQKKSGLLVNSHLIIFNKEKTRKIKIDGLIYKLINQNFTMFKLYGLNLIEKRILMIIKFMLGDNFYKKIRNYIKSKFKTDV
tara:strand:+ start:358 stop:1125 length:768 start_codon:yes stop_codon:yes gene_type:complete